MLSIRWRTFWKGKCIGVDAFGNRYYTSRFFEGAWHEEPRWVIYRGIAEASKVPSSWHGWLHHRFQEAPQDNETSYPWEKRHRPNLTGTPYAFCPEQKPSHHLASYGAWGQNSVIPKKIKFYEQSKN